MRAIGRVLQKLALAVPPVAIVLQLVPRNAFGDPILTLGQMLVALVAAVCMFWIGRILEAYGTA